MRTSQNFPTEYHKVCNKLRNTNPNANNDKSGTEQSGAHPHLLPQGHGRHSGGGEGGGVGDGDGQGDGGVAEDAEESGGGGEVDEERDGVVPDGDEINPLAELAREASVAVWWAGSELLVPELGPAAHEGVGDAPDQAHSDHLRYVVAGHLEGDGCGCCERKL